MRYNVAQLMLEGIGSVRQHDLEGVLYEVDEDNPGPVPVQGHVQLIRTLRGVLAKGQATVQLREPCRRCLELTTTEAQIEIEEEFVPSIDIITGVSLPLTDEDEPALRIDEHHILDLTEVLRQYTVVAGTTGPLCRPDCKGLCPFCGANRNTEPCQCETKRGDPRLAILAKLLDAQHDDESNLSEGEMNR